MDKKFNFDLFSDLFGLENNIEKIDLTTDEGYETYNKTVDELEKLVNSSSFFKLLIDDDTINAFRKFGNDVHEKSQDKTETCDMNCEDCDLDYCTYCDNIEEDDIDESENENTCGCGCSCTSRKECDCTCGEKFMIPSEKIDNIDTKLQIHRLTQKYIDEMVKPYLGNTKDANRSINDAYSALYEFACWIYTQK